MRGWQIFFKSMVIIGNIYLIMLNVPSMIGNENSQEQKRWRRMLRHLLFEMFRYVQLSVKLAVPNVWLFGVMM